MTNALIVCCTHVPGAAIAILEWVLLRPLTFAAAALTGLIAGFGCSGDDPSRQAGAMGESTPRTAESTSRTDTRTALPAATGVRLLRLGSFAQPTYLTAPRGDRRRRFVVERAGRIRVVRDGRKLKTTFLDIAGDVQIGGESGLLSMAFAPDYSRSRRFYVYYVGNDGLIRIDEFKRSSSSPDRADPGSRRRIWLQEHHRFNHKGGQLQFGPDGMLYFGFGDGGGRGDPDRNAQNLGRPLGKLMRIDPRPSRGRAYRIPADNPFAHRSGARGEVYAYGLRNPFRFSFDRSKGHLTIGDVGQDSVEEIDFIRNTRGKGKTPRGGYNFGWSLFEGRSRFRDGSVPGHVPPVTQRTHAQGSCSITGGYVVRDRALGRRLYGRYVYGDLCDAKLRLAGLRAGRVAFDRALGPRVPSMSSFGEDGIGRVYALSLNGPVYRLAPR